MNRLRHPRGGADIREFPFALRIALRGGRTIVPQQHIRPVANRKVKVRPAVVVIVPAGDCLDKAGIIESGLFGALGKSAVAIVAKQLARIDVAVARFVADKEVEPAIAVLVEPNSRMRGVETEQAGFLGHGGKSAVAVASQRGVWMMCSPP